MKIMYEKIDIQFYHERKISNFMCDSKFFIEFKFEEFMKTPNHPSHVKYFIYFACLCEYKTLQTLNEMISYVLHIKMQICEF